MRETWYVLEDDSPGNPAECSLGEDGIFRHKDGLAVKMRSADCPMSRGVDLDPHGKLPSLAVPPKEKEAPAAKDREVKPEKAAKPAKSGKPGTYKTRETQAE